MKKNHHFIPFTYRIIANMCTNRERRASVGIQKHWRSESFLFLTALQYCIFAT